MSVLTREARYVQNPALGAALLWRFTVGYTQAHSTSDAPALPLCFLVLPIVLHYETFELLQATYKTTGLHGFADKFSRSEVGRSDLLLAVHSRAESMRRLTTESLRAAVRHSLLTIATRDAKLIPLTTTKPTGVPQSVRPLIDGAEKLGLWFSSLSLFEVTSALKVSL